MSGVRFTLWLDEDERDALAREAGELASSSSYVMRLAFRLFVGLPVPSWASERMSDAYTWEDGREREPAA